MNILFIHSAWPNQFSLLHSYLCKTSLANSFFLTSETTRSAAQYTNDFPVNVFSYTEDSRGNKQDSYYYSESVERNARNALGVIKAAHKIIESKKIDIIVAHDVIGFPQLLFNEISRPIVSYIEFPSYFQHKWDSQYPPTDGQRYRDKYREMLSLYCMAKSDAIICPSLYAKNLVLSLYPSADKIHVQMEGFNQKLLNMNEKTLTAFKKQPNLIYIGFASRTLSSEKGFEHFVKVSNQLSKINPNLRFVVIGETKASSYGYESVFLQKLYPKKPDITFKDYLFSKNNVDESKYIFTGKLSMDAFSSTIYNIDLFLYPLQYGSATWGLFELLLRGRIVVASERCFIPEVIEDGKNGFIRNYDDIEGWCDIVTKITNNINAFQDIGISAKSYGEKFYIENIASQYLELFNKIILSY